MSIDASIFEEQLHNLQATYRGQEDDLRAEIEKLIDQIISDLEHTEEFASVFEQSLEALLQVYTKIGDGSKFSGLLDHLQPYFLKISKARVAKCVRIIIQSLRKVKGTRELQISLCRQWIAWATTEERTLLRQRLETELAEILLEERQYYEALDILSRLSNELRKVDHKSQLIEVHLIESRTFRCLGDLSHAKAALTAARTNAAAVYTPPLLQGQLDLESGIINTDDREYRTASSYFTEAFEAFASTSDKRAFDALKYGLLCKILDEKPSQCEQLHRTAIQSLSNSLSNSDPLQLLQIEAMLEIAKAAENKSLHELTNVMENRKKELEADPVVHSNIKNLVENLEEQHLLRIVKSYSAVELETIASMIDLPLDVVESKSSIDEQNNEACMPEVSTNKIAFPIFNN